MAGEQTLPNFGFIEGWTLGTNGWKPGMDANFLMLDTLLVLTVASSTLATPPSSPANGDRYIVGPSPTGAWASQAGNIAVYLNSAWAFYAPKLNLRATVSDLGTVLRWDGTAWSRVNPYDIQMFRWLLPNPSTSEPLLSLLMSRPILLLAGLTESLASLKVATTNALTLSIQQNGSAIGTVNFPGGATVGTFSFAASVTLARGDVLEVVPQSFDPTAKGLRLVFVGYR